MTRATSLLLVCSAFTVACADAPDHAQDDSGSRLHSMHDASAADDAAQGGRLDAQAALDGRATHPDDASQGDSALDARADGSADAGAVEMTPPCVTFALPSDCPASSLDELPSDLRCTGLYGDFAARAIACGIEGYTPAFALWSDGADKHRYASIPAGSQIDAADPDNFVYPVGTQFWKEFRLQTSQGWVPGETRLLRKTTRGWSYTSYVWTADGKAATRTDDGVSNLFGSGHDVPTTQQCLECHQGRADFILGWDWLLLGPGSLGLTREQLAAKGLVKNEAHPSDHQATIPGDEIERAALGYLHVNCGVSCHNQSALAEAHEIGLFMRLEIGSVSRVQDTAVFKTGINHVPNWWSTAFIWGSAPAGGFYDFRPGDPARSYALQRALVRGSDKQMPKVGTNRVDDAGVQAITDWINHMSTSLGYPAPAM